MGTIIIYPENEAQKKALHTMLEGFRIPFEEKKEIKLDRSKKQDDTDYLLSSPKNKKALQKSIQQVKDGKVIKVNLDDIRK